MRTFNKQEFSIRKLRDWFEGEKRNFPWRENPTPYRVWISEVMLQQTRAKVVIPYFLHWIELFPDIHTLASASIDEVIKAWEGLGYYSRARNIHEAAKYLLKYHNGELPSDPKKLQKVKGLGPYTIGAILSFAFHQKAAAIDGNVARVMSRFFLLEEEIHSSFSQKFLKQKVEEFLPDTKPWIIMEALIELGAKICTKKPDCKNCPLKENCLGFRLGKTKEIPKKKNLPSITVLERKVFLIHYQKEFLVQKHHGKKVMADLYEFPYVEKEEMIETVFAFPLQFTHYLKKVTHTFTRYKAHLFPRLCETSQKKQIIGYEWISGKKLSKLSFSSGHKKILKELLEDYAHLTY